MVTIDLQPQVSKLISSAMVTSGKDLPNLTVAVLIGVSMYAMWKNMM
jgi:hypothetical protein